MLHDPGFERDGRRPQSWRDKLETVIAGDWVWEEGEIAGVKHGGVGLAMGSGTGQRTIYNIGKNRKASRSAMQEDRGVGVAKGITVKDQYMHLDNEIPETRTVAHIPGELCALRHSVLRRPDYCPQASQSLITFTCSMGRSSLSQTRLAQCLHCHCWHQRQRVRVSHLHPRNGES